MFPKANPEQQQLNDEIYIQWRGLQWVHEVTYSEA